MRFASTAAGVALLLTLAGCNKGDGRLNAKGRIVKGGVPSPLRRRSSSALRFFR